MANVSGQYKDKGWQLSVDSIKTRDGNCLWAVLKQAMATVSGQYKDKQWQLSMGCIKTSDGNCLRAV